MKPRRGRNARTRNAKRRDRAQPTNRSGDPRVAHHEGYPQGAVGTIGRPWRRMGNAVARGEMYERAVGRADNQQDREAAQRALFIQIAKVERLQHVLTR